MIAIRCRYCGNKPQIVYNDTHHKSGYMLCPCQGMIKWAYENGVTPAPFLIMTILFGKDKANRTEEDAVKIWNDIQAYGTIKP